MYHKEPQNSFHKTFSIWQHFRGYTHFPVLTGNKEPNFLAGLGSGRVFEDSTKKKIN